MVKVDILEGGTYVIRWKSMEKQPSDSNFYRISIETKIKYKILGTVLAKGEKEYGLLVRGYSAAVNPLPNGIIKVALINPKLNKIMEKEDTIYQSV